MSRPSRLSSGAFVLQFLGGPLLLAAAFAVVFGTMSAVDDAPSAFFLGGATLLLGGVWAGSCGSRHLLATLLGLVLSLAAFRHWLPALWSPPFLYFLVPFLAGGLGALVCSWRPGSGDRTPKNSDPDAWWTACIFGLPLSFAFLEAGCSLQPLGLWWGLYWLWPCAALVLLAARCSGGTRRRTLIIALAVSTYVLAAVVELWVGHTVARPWWYTHVLLGSGLLVLCAALLPEFPSAGAAAALVLLTLALPWIGLTPAQRLWRDCRRLRIGMHESDALECLSSQYILIPERVGGGDRLLIRDLDSAARTRFASADAWTVGHEGFNADVCFLEFESGRLARYWMSPD